MSILNPNYAPKEEPFLSIVIPAYNEEKRISHTLDKIALFLGGLPYPVEVIVADDGSRDGTKEVVKSKASSMPPNGKLLLLSHSLNRGKGAAVRQGCLAAQGKFVVFTDADLPTPIAEVDKLLAALEAGNHLAIGSRVHPSGYDMRATQPWFRRALGQLYHLATVLLGIRGIPDTQCGFKGFTREVVQSLFPHLRISGWVFDTELLYQAQKRGLLIAQVPVTWANVGGSRMRVTLKQVIGVLADLFSVRFYHGAERYDSEIGEAHFSHKSERRDQS